MCITDGWCWRVFMCWFPLFYSWPACPRSAAAVSHSRMLCEMGEGVISNEKVAQAVENSLQHDYLQTTPCGATRTTLRSQWMEKWRRGRLETCADIFLLKSRDVLWIFTATLLLSVQFCDPLCQARPDVSRPLRSLRNFFASCLTVINWGPNKRFLTWLSTAPPWENVSLDTWVTDSQSSVFLYCGFKKPGITVNMMQCDNSVFTFYLTETLP